MHEQTLTHTYRYLSANLRTTDEWCTLLGERNPTLVCSCESPWKLNVNMNVNVIVMYTNCEF